MNDTTVIQPIQRFSIVQMCKELYRYRELFFFFAWRDYKVRYKQTSIGILWAVLQPLLTMIAFVVFFGRFEQITNTGIPYVLFVYSGLLLWQLFSSGITDASNSLIESGSIVTKIYFPRILIPISSIFVRLIDFAFSSIILIALLFWYQISPSFSILLIIPILLLLYLLTSGIGIILAAINIKYRDVRYVIPFFVQLTLFLSPVIYASSHFGDKAIWMQLNPVTGIIESFRSVVFSLPFPYTSFLISCIFTLVFLFLGIVYFKRTEKTLVDII